MSQVPGYCALGSSGAISRSALRILGSLDFVRTVPGQSFNTNQLTAVQLTLSKFSYDGELNPNFREGSFSLQVESISTF